MTTLQQQYPLSSRKFLKKMLEKMVLWLFLAVAFVVVLSIIISYPSIVTASPTSAVITFLVIVGLPAAFFLYTLYVRAYIRSYYYDATDDYLTIRKGVFTPVEIHIQYAKIQDVYVDQDLFDRMLGIYDVHLATATIASGIAAHIDGVDAPVAEGLKGFLLQKFQSPGQENQNPVSPTPPAQEGSVPLITHV